MDPLCDHTPPMPLKHFTETFLVVLLGVVIAATGLLTASLPHLPQGALPWSVLFVLALIYPLSLYSLFQRRRADNFFRRLHWFPAFILLVWLLMEGISLGSEEEHTFRLTYTWGWSLVPVVLGFFLVIVFCLQVIRRRVTRLFFLSLILIPFTAMALLSEKEGRVWNQELASVLWDAEFFDIEETGLLARFIETEKEEEKNLEPSEDPQEEDWRARLRAQERRSKRIAARLERSEERESHTAQESEASLSSNSSLRDIQEQPTKALSGTGDELRNAGTMPDHLPKSGFGFGVLSVSLLAGYCTTLQKRAGKRV